MIFFLRFFIKCGLVSLLVLQFSPSEAKVYPEQYGIVAFDQLVNRKIVSESRQDMDSIFRNHPVLNHKVFSALTRPRFYYDRTADFYLLTSLVLLLGLIRLIDPKYFKTLWHALKSPGQSRQLKEKLQSASFPNVMMNLFFTMSAGAYIFYLVKYFTPQRPGNIAPSLLIIMLIAGMMVIYLVKYAAIRFSGWAFKLETITDFYLFNVFLVNKILAVLLLPFTILLAFSGNDFAQPALIVSFLIILLLFASRYLRSWSVFGSFFQYSKFHFFMYLCASELLPLAVLMKLLVRGLLY